MKLLFRPRRTDIRMAFGVLLGVLVLSTVSATISSSQAPSKFSQPNSVLIQYRDDDEQAIHSALIVNEKWFWLPSNLLLETGSTATNLRMSAASLNVSTSANWFGQTYDLKSPESWVIDRGAVTAIVDLIDGISILPAEDVQLRDSDQIFMVLKANVQTRLSGTPAGLYALTSQSAFEQVWRAIMADLDAAYLPTVLPAIGAASRSTLEINALISYIEKLQVRTQQGSLVFQQISGQPKLVQGEVFDVLTVDELALLSDAGILPAES